MIANGNVYGALIVGLGCEIIQEETYLNAIRQKTDKPVYYISMQKGGLAKTVAKGAQLAESCVPMLIDVRGRIAIFLS